MSGEMSGEGDREGRSLKLDTHECWQVSYWMGTCMFVAAFAIAANDKHMASQERQPRTCKHRRHVVAVHHVPIVVTIDFLPLLLIGIPKTGPNILRQVPVRSFGVVVAEAHCCCADTAAAHLLLLIQTATCTSRFRVGFRKVFGGCCRRRVVLVVERMGRYIENKLMFGMELSDS